MNFIIFSDGRDKRGITLYHFQVDIYGKQQQQKHGKDLDRNVREIVEFFIHIRHPQTNT
ncbi:MAG: hypothetical protein V7L29_31980 [Nostoc sp.]|uniref:hypothetical protein n=1 Tax=Nostoc sp. TaxID=1180 RepID=UPI002FEEA9EB